MATIVQCDGCRAPITDPQVRGLAIKREYCATCAVACDTFEQAEDALRASMVERFNTDRELLISKFSEGGFKLPDVA